MAEPKGMTEIEDVLSSIRRLVAADTRVPAAGSTAPAAEDDPGERLVLTPAQRIDDSAAVAGADLPPTDPEPMSHSMRAWEADSLADRDGAAHHRDSPEDIEAALAALEAELDATGGDGVDALPDAPESMTGTEAAAGPEPWADDDDPDVAAADMDLSDAATAGGADAAADMDPDDAAETGLAGTDPAAMDLADCDPDRDLAEAAPADDAGLAEADGADPVLAGPCHPGDEAWREPAEYGHDLAAGADDAEAADLAADPDAAPFLPRQRHGFIWEAAFEEEAARPDAEAEGFGAMVAEEDAAPDVAWATGTDIAEDARLDDGPMPVPEADDMAAPRAEDDTWDDAEAAVAVLPDPDEPEVPLPPATGPEAEPALAVPADSALSAPPAEAWADAPDLLAPPPADAAETDLAAPGLFEADDFALDEAALRDVVAEIVRDELRGALGARIARNVRQIVRQEIARELAARGLHDDI